MPSSPSSHFNLNIHMESGTRSSRLKQRLARLFRSACKPSASAANLGLAASSRALLEDAALEPAFVPRRRRDHCSLDECFFSPIGDHRRLEVSRRLSVDCSSCRPSQAAPLAAKSKKWGRKERRVRETGAYYETGEWEGTTCPPASPSSPSKSSYYYHCFFNNGAAAAAAVIRAEKRKKKKKTKRLQSNGYGFSSSSSMESDEEEEDAFFSSEGREGKGEEETETFFSSRSFSSDSSEFYRRPASKKKNNNKKNKEAKKVACPQRRRARNKQESWGGGCKGLQPLLSVGGPAAKAKRGGFAVVKRSSNPYGDFRSSMVEMIMERQMFGKEELESLLQSYLSLNSSQLHPLILQAFSDIWVVLLGH
ncbi:hypothetical protein Cni_G09509 [Canna indica]|uniref:Transcription repressor n=1 Tax=Canna indica TaxID=4628 RepID=A0AAQ3Q8Y7_9LILI|nr:hypothetical protein Cni_G09509 [Canna indica]